MNHLKLFTLFSALFFILPFAHGQYEFSDDLRIACTEVKNQQRTGTCWSFSTLSFLESELIREGKKPMDLSEMYVVRNIYLDKARNYILRQGKANFSQGSLSHDVINAWEKNGLVPEQAYSGRLNPTDPHNHRELVKELKALLDATLESFDPKWTEKFEAIMDQHLGAAPAEILLNEKAVSPIDYANDLDLAPSDYISISSYTHHPFYQQFILEVPDNYSNGDYFNLPMQDMKAVADNALAQGYTIAWDGDVSEKGFSSKNGLAILPKDPKREDLFKTPGKEIQPTQELRQTTFESFSTTDDHLMHIVGKAEDQKGNRYYIVKNSWGEVSEFKGYLYMSEAYFLLKTVGIMVHKDAVPKAIAQKLEM